jgi:SNF2 family DNA or RNA helicase
VDEGHRIKNLNCRLIKELKLFQSANRLLLTGTPLHVSKQKKRGNCLSILIRIENMTYFMIMYMIEQFGRTMVPSEFSIA